MRKVVSKFGLFAGFAACLLAAASPASARALPGFKCMMLNITEQQAMDPNFHVTVRSAPSATASPAGWAGAVVITYAPLREQNGFTEMVLPNGHSVWVESDMVKPYHAKADPTARCVPEVLPNGRIGFGPG
jgi:hypothetical protein